MLEEFSIESLLQAPIQFPENMTPYKDKGNSNCIST